MDLFAKHEEQTARLPNFFFNHKRTSFSGKSQLNTLLLSSKGQTYREIGTQSHGSAAKRLCCKCASDRQTAEGYLPLAVFFIYSLSTTVKIFAREL